MPEAMITHLTRLSIEPPPKTQISNFLKIIRKKRKITPNTTLNHFKNGCEKHATIPSDEDEVFVGSFELNALSEQLFRVFLTTKRLLSICLNSKHILADATYKLTSENFPVLTGGTTDKSKSFHPFGIAVTTNEKDIDFAFFLYLSKMHVREFFKQIFLQTFWLRIMQTPSTMDSNQYSN